MPIDTDEFLRWMNLIREDLRGVSYRLDQLNGRVRDNEEAIAVLKDRGIRGASALWGGSVAGGVIGGWEVMKWWLGR